MASPFLAEILGPDLLVILAIVAVLFGGARLPKLARSLGSAKSEFEKGLREGASGDKDDKNKAEPAAAAATPAPGLAAEDNVTMTRAELDAMLAKERNAANGEQPTS